MIVSAALGLTLVAALGAAAFLVLWLDRFKGEPAVRFVLVALWGAACALAFFLARPTLAAPGNLGLGAGEAPLLAAAVSVLDEVMLAAGLAVLATSHYLDGPLDGAAYGTVAGLGWAAFHVASSLWASPPPADPAAPVIAALGQAGAAALVGGALGFAKLAVRAPLRSPLVLCAALVAGAYRWTLGWAAAWGWQRWAPRAAVFDGAVGAAGALVLVAVFAAALAFEARVLARQLGEEVTFGVLPEWVLTVIPSYRRRVRSDWWPKRDERREVVRLLTSLAYRKQRLGVLSELRANLYSLEVGRLRQRARTVMALAARPTESTEP